MQRRLVVVVEHLQPLAGLHALRLRQRRKQRAHVARAREWRGARGRGVQPEGLLDDRVERGEDGLLRAALSLSGLREEALRRSRLLQIRHGLRLDLRAGLHLRETLPGLAPSDYNRAVAVALHLHQQAAPGAILASTGAWESLRGTLRFEAQGADSGAAAYALLDETVD